MRFQGIRLIIISQVVQPLEQQGVQGDNIRSAMQEVEDVMDSLVRGFENQLDMLFDDEALDISTDITVLEQMLAWYVGCATDFSISCGKSNKQVSHPAQMF